MHFVFSMFVVPNLSQPAKITINFHFWTQPEEREKDSIFLRVHVRLAGFLALFVGFEIKSEKIINKNHNVQHLRYGKVGLTIPELEIDAVTHKERQLYYLNYCYQRFHYIRYLAQLIEGAEKVIRVHHDVNDAICYSMNYPKKP